MPKIIKNGKEYSGVPIEVVTAWAPTADPVQVKEPLMGNTDISNIGDGTVTGAIDTLNTGLSNLTVVATTYRDFTVAANARTVLYPTLPTIPTGYRAVLLTAQMAVNSKDILFQGVANNNAMFYSTFATALSGSDFPLYCIWIVIPQ